MNGDPVPYFASLIQRHKLEGPAILLLEMHKPMAGIAHTMTLLWSPLLAAIGAGSVSKALVQLFESRENIEKLITTLESHDRN